jgi:hypothetical protein
VKTQQEVLNTKHLDHQFDINKLGYKRIGLEETPDIQPLEFQKEEWVNPRLKQEREASAKKTGIVRRVFAEEGKDLKEKAVDIAEAEKDWDQNIANLPVRDPDPDESKDVRGPIAVPFFPTHWQENSNAIFNNEFMIINDINKEQEVKKHGRKLRTMKDDALSPELVQKMNLAQKYNQEYERPTSGKHFARILQHSNINPSALAQDYFDGMKVDKLMKKLANYMKEGDFDDGSPDPYQQYEIDQLKKHYYGQGGQAYHEVKRQEL